MDGNNQQLPWIFTAIVLHLKKKVLSCDTMQRLSLHKAIIRAALIAALAFLSCNPIEEPFVPSGGYFYILELGASTVEFPPYGGSFTLKPEAITFYDGHKECERALSLSDLDIAFLSGDDYIFVDGMTFSAGQTTVKRAAFYRVTWKEKGISREICLTQRKR